MIFVVFVIIVNIGKALQSYYLSHIIIYDKVIYWLYSNTANFFGKTNKI